MNTTSKTSTPGEILEEFHQLLESGVMGSAREILTRLHPSEIADILESLPGKERETVWNLVDPEVEGDVLSELQDAVRTDLLEQMHPHEVAEATKDLDIDDAADIIQDLPENIQDSVLLSMDEQNRQRIASALSYHEDTAGGLMNTDVISIRAEVTLDVVSRYLRRIGNIPSGTDNLMVVDRENKYLGVLSLVNLLIREPERNVSEFMTEESGIDAETTAAEVATIFEHRDLVSAAVVDKDNRLLGRITIDDVVDVIQEKAERTVRSMAGLGEDDMFSPVLYSARRRALWLGINLATAFLASWVIDRFEETIQQLVALAVLMPIVAGMGGIAGSQTLTITIRGIALGQIGRSNARALLSKELAVGLLNGIVWAFIVCLIVIFWFKDVPLGMIIGLAMIINLIIAALAGASIPVILKRFRIDPAIAGGVILTTITDVVGFMTFLGLATIFLIA